jgi:hypothetical protein
MRQMAAAEPEIGGRSIKAVVTGERDADVGRVCGLDGVSPWRMLLTHSL